MVTRSFEIATPSALRRALLSTAALALLVGAGSCDSDSSSSGGSTGNASVKFCNNLTSQAGPLELSLMIGNPPVTLKASSGQCSSTVGANCASVASGSVPWRVLLEGQVVIAGSTPMFNSDQFVFLATVQNMQPIIADELIEDGTKCAQLNPFEAAPGAGGAGGGAGGTGGTLPPRAADQKPGTVIPLPFDVEAYDRLGLERHAPR